MNRFIIVGTQRTGSTLVGATVCMHADAFCGWEWSQRQPFHLKFKVAERGYEGDFSLLGEPERDHIRRYFTGRERWIGFRRLFRSSDKWLFHPALAPALFADRFEEHIRWIARQKEMRVIHVVRRNNLDWMKSKELSRVSQAYSKKAYPDDLKVEISTSEARRRLKSKAWVDRRLSTLARTNPYYRVTYEDFRAERESERERLLAFLDCDMKDYDFREIALQQQSKGDSQDYITNLDELRATLDADNLLWSDL